MATSGIRRPSQFSANQKEKFRKALSQTKRYQVAALVPLVGAAVVVSVSRHYVADLGALPLALSIVFLALVSVGFTWVNWRCPTCRNYLGNSLKPEQCPSCGVDLRFP
jgi:rubrerythrin